jgi:hypothetical protein
MYPLVSQLDNTSLTIFMDKKLIAEELGNKFRIPLTLVEISTSMTNLLVADPKPSQEIAFYDENCRFVIDKR